MTNYECKHIREKKAPAISTVTHQAIAGAPTRADDLGTKTKLCLICSGWLINLLARLEQRGAPSD